MDTAAPAQPSPRPNDASTAQDASAGLAALLREDERALLPFLAWAQPFFATRQARILQLLQTLASQYPERLMVQPLQACVCAAFAAPLLNWLARTLVLELGMARHQQLLEGDSPEARFTDFVNYVSSPHGRRYLNRTYPLLRKNLVLRSKQVERSLRALLRRVARDFPRLQRLHGSATGPLQSFKTQMGDRHADGGSVARLQFESALLYYKPRSMALDVAWEKLLAWLAREGVQPTQRAARVLDCGTYGYAAAVPWQSADNEAELQLYYQRFGGLVALAYALGTTDLHHENLLASGAWPVIIDTETLFQPAHGGSGASAGPGRPPFADTVIYSGLLPHGTLNGAHSDTTALFMPDKALFSRVPSDAGTDQMRLTMQQVALPFAANMPRLRGEAVAPHQYADAICAGFDLTYSALLARKTNLLAEHGPLAALRQAQVRTILRPTQVYAVILTWLSHPDYQRDSVQAEKLLARLKPPAPENGAGQRAGAKQAKQARQAKQAKAMLACWESERDALLRGDVPYFVAQVDSCTLQDERGRVIDGVFATSGWQEAQRNVRRLSAADHVRQRRLLREAVAGTAPLLFEAENTPPQNEHPATPAPAFDAQQLLQQAVRIGDHILAQAMGSAVHPVYYQLEMRGHEVLRPFPLCAQLYDGLSGLALFYAQLAHSSGLPRFARAAEITLASVRREYESMQAWPDSCGAFSGLAGWLYTLAFLGARLQRPEWINEACAGLPRLAQQIGQDQQFDVIAGCAGALLVLLELERLAPGRGALEVARLCATHLQEHAVLDEQGARWIGAAHPAHALSGFSHGTIGIACALARYADLTGDAALMALVREALRFERASFDPASGLWRDLRADRCEHDGQAGAVYAWCHGAPGIGLGFLALPPALQDAQWRQDIHTTLAATRKHGFVGSHCLCHGQLGNLDYWLQYAEQWHDPAQQQAWREMAMRLLQQGQSEWRSGSAARHDLLGLMTGLAGIGYGLLRCTRPQDVPSVLSLQLP